MQLKRLYVNDYKIFKDFTYEFPVDSSRHINILIGANGSGKSTILEAIAEIFSCAVLGEKAKFGFKLEYSVKFESPSLKSDSGLQWYKIDQIEVSISASGPDANPEIIANMPGGNVLKSIKEVNSYNSLSRFNPSISSNLFKILPDRIVMYYSGFSEIMYSICIPHNNRLSEKLRKGIINEPDLFYYHEPKLFNLLLMSLLSFEYGDIPEYLKQKAKISGMDNIVITLKKPYWANDTIQNFWGAKGEVRDFLNYVDLISIKDSKSINGKGMVIIERSSDQHIDITIFGSNKLFEIRDYLAEERNLFKIVYSMYLDDLLDEITISLIQEANGKQIIFNDLSEGEQQALTIKGLTELLSGENSLFLFDEPDTYLHPKWQGNFISDIENDIQINHQNELSYIIATHSPQILANSNPEKTFVKIIESGQLVEQTPKHFGREISSILYNLMGVEERNENIRNDLSNLFMLIENEEIEEVEKALERLTEILGDTDSDIQNALIQLNYLKDEEN